MRVNRTSTVAQVSEAGFTLVELLVYVIIGGIVMASVYQLLVGQMRGYTKQRELMDVHGSLRGAAALMAWELRQASAVGGDLYAVGPDTVALRSIQGTGIVCAEHATLPRFGLQAAGGMLEATVDDSTLILAVGGAGTADDVWKILKLQQVDDPVTLGVGTCAWTGGGAPEIAVEVAGDTAGIGVGAPFRAFRRVQYGLYQDGGRWWLGRKTGGAASYEKLTGPMLAPGSGGLQLMYYDAAGVVTADPTQVAVVEIILRGESYGTVQNSDGGFQQDTLATKVALRG